MIDTALAQLDAGYRKIWCVVDADFFVHLTGKQRAAAERAYNQALGSKIDVIFSMPCFEVWFRRHFNAESSSWENGDRAKAEIAKIWPGYLLQPSRHWELLRDQLRSHALPNARKARLIRGNRPAECSDASTDVDRLIYDLFCGIEPNDPGAPS